MSGFRRWRSIFPARPEQEIEDELRFHLEEREADYVASGMSPEAARRAAAERLGDLKGVKRECAALLGADRTRRERRVRWAVSWLDVKLGLRMVRKHPALSAVAVAGMAVAIAVGAAYLTALGTMLDPVLPFPEGDRVVAVRNLDTRHAGDGRRASAEELAAWRDGLRSVRELGAFRDDRRNLIAEDGSTALVRVAEMSASGFTLTRTAPLLGRTLLPEDERPEAAPVVVLGEHEWRRRFEGNPGVLGRTVSLDGAAHTVVGVMPAGFRFPIDHGYWVPLQLAAEPPATGSLEVFGRLAEGVGLDQARAELALAGQRLAAVRPETHGHVRPHLFHYPHAFVGIKNSPEVEASMRGVQLLASLVLLVVAVNVSVLVYARTAARAGEIAVRTALGASRARVVTQLFVEALVLSAAACVLGLGLARVALRLAEEFLREGRGAGDEFPFWISLDLSPGVVLHVALLAVLAAVIVGVLPALAVTGRRLQSGLQQFSARGSSVDLGRTWTALVVLQVAAAVVGLPLGVGQAHGLLRAGSAGPAPGADRLLRADLAVAQEREGDAARRVTTLIARLAAEPDVAAVALADRFPGEERFGTLELEPMAGAPAPGLLFTRTNRVEPAFFAILDVPTLAGRSLTTADAHGDAAAVVVDQTFADRLGGPVVGRRVRYAADEPGENPGPWLEVVGVVPAFTHRVAPLGTSSPSPRLFHAATPAATPLASMVVKLRDPATPAAAARLRDLAASVDPSIRLDRLRTVATAWHAGQRTMRFVALALMMVLASVPMLSAAGIYALMAFTVTKRRREIGIRRALGADARRVLTGVFARASAQLGTGVLAGLTLAVVLDRAAGGGVLEGPGLLLLPGAAAFMAIVGLLASLGPARQGLRVEPTEALRED